MFNFMNAITDFPFMADLPKRELTKVQNVVEELHGLSDLAAVYGLPIPQSFAAKCLNVSPQRVHQLLETGQLEPFDWAGERCVTKRSLVVRMQSERLKGRPKKEKS